MTQDEMITSLHDALRDHLKWPHLSAFHARARLNEDLYLDSILILQLILHLELEKGILVEDDALVGADFQTVAQLAAALRSGDPAAPGSETAAVDAAGTGAHD